MSSSSPAGERKQRCMRLVDRTNGLKFRGTERCPNEAAPDSSLCVRHLSEAMDDGRRIFASMEAKAYLARMNGTPGPWLGPVVRSRGNSGSAVPSRGNGHAIRTSWPYERGPCGALNEGRHQGNGGHRANAMAAQTPVPGGVPSKGNSTLSAFSMSYGTSGETAASSWTQWTAPQGKQPQNVYPMQSPWPAAGQNVAVTIRDWWAARSRAAAARNARQAADAHLRGVSRVRGLRELTDDELIAQSPVREQPLVPASRDGDAAAAGGLDRSADQGDVTGALVGILGSVAIGALTVVLVALTIVLALKS